MYSKYKFLSVKKNIPWLKMRGRISLAITSSLNIVFSVTDSKKLVLNLNFFSLYMISSLIMA